MPFSTVLNDESNMLVLFRDVEDGQLYLQVTCGGVVCQTLGIRLTESETNEFANSKESLSRLARDVCFRPSHYEPRMVSADVLREWNP
jgi:hypothetical protein